jgi:kumamolisin
MNIPTPPVGLAALEAAYQTLGQLISTFSGQPSTPAPHSYAQLPHKTAGARRLKCRNYLEFARTLGLKPRTGGPFKVADLCTAYNFPTGLAGGGVIGILELSTPNSNSSCGYTQADLDLFSQNNGLPQIIPTDVSVKGGQNIPGGDGDVEVLLDIQVAAAVYFFCTGQLPTIKVFFAPNDDTSFAAGINAAVAAGCDVLSISWGKDEAGWDPTVASQVEAAAQAATASGLVLFAAAGDNSSGDGAPGANVDLPSSCPHIIGCGGTRKMPFSEVVWGDGTPNGEGTGGGYSVLFPPQAFQLHAPPSPGQAGRMVPDVAADAAPETGYLIVANGQQGAVGGTSAVAPLYSGLFAAFGQKLGFVTPTLWQNPGAFVDITEGSNGSFDAAVGPDPCTGLGVPNGAALAALFGGSPRRRSR